ncbi:MAG: FkbM family methyltransferase [Woeseia sp.]|nr:FkbM family methyltransferase [Gammaproteobacteria bacterium]NNL50596.1 FkbM family methyltransferase [Woeseiaceae bacterium]NNL54878.1 FkbM family methyltransferase [Woeseia sp.]
MTKTLKKAINRALAIFGVRLTMTRNDDAHRIVSGLLAKRVDVVLDVGANNGQFAASLRGAGYRGKIACFEPLPDAHEKLKNRFAHDTDVIVHPRTALGDERGSVQMNVSRNSVSSSILNLLPSHADAAPDSEYVDNIETDIDCLDNVFADYVTPGDRVFLKIDTQGYEWTVLDGAAQSIKKIDGLLLEMSLVPLYEGQRLWKDIQERLEAEGFVLWQILPGFSDPESGRTLQFDGIFYREKSVRDFKGLD